jgi:hypothetical protein
VLAVPRETDSRITATATFVTDPDADPQPVPAERT